MARPQTWIPVLLALAAGCVDAVSFVLLHHVFTANMTGNDTLLGVAAGQGAGKAFVPLFVAVIAFVVAVGLGTFWIELMTRRGIEATALPVLLVEMALVAGFMVYGHHLVHGHTVPGTSFSGFYVLLCLSVLAMGLQTASVVRALGLAIPTTYVSGVLTNFSQDLVNVVAPPRDGRPSYLRDQLHLGSRRDSAARLALRFGVTAAFALGAAWAGYTERRWSTWGIALALVLLAAVALIELRRPRSRHTPSRN